MKSAILSLLGFVLLASPAPAQGDSCPLKENDVVVMLGDSITAQHLHSNYIEAYCVTRFPQWKLRFRNAGVGGSTVPSALVRFDYDVAIWHPTVVSIELGMNDASGGPKGVEPYKKGMGVLIERIEKIGARPVFLTASPVNDGTGPSDEGKRNATLQQMANAVTDIAAKGSYSHADQFHALVDLWQQNFKKGKDGISLHGDAVHPAEVGQLTMAYACLTGLAAPALVSKASIDAAGGKVAAEQCKISDLKVDGATISFTRSDDCLPMPIPPKAQAALGLVPLTEKLNEYTLTVNGLKPGKYSVTIDEVPVAVVGADELGKGWNMSELTKGPVAEQCQKVLQAVAACEAAVSKVRDVAKKQATSKQKDLAAEVKTQQQAELQRLIADVEAADERLHQAALPKPHHFEIAPMP